MVVEIVAGRMIAPYVGMSLYTWTAIIAVVLAGFSIGNWIGKIATSKITTALRVSGGVMMFAAMSTACDSRPIFQIHLGALFFFRAGIRQSIGFKYALGLMYSVIWCDNWNCSRWFLYLFNLYTHGVSVVYIASSILCFWLGRVPINLHLILFLTSMYLIICLLYSS